MAVVSGLLPSLTSLECRVVDVGALLLVLLLTATMILSDLVQPTLVSLVCPVQEQEAARLGIVALLIVLSLSACGALTATRLLLVLVFARPALLLLRPMAETTGPPSVLRSRPMPQDVDARPVLSHALKAPTAHTPPGLRLHLVVTARLRHLRDASALPALSVGDTAEAHAVPLHRRLLLPGTEPQTALTAREASALRSAGRRELQAGLPAPPLTGVVVLAPLLSSLLVASTGADSSAAATTPTALRKALLTTLTTPGPCPAATVALAALLLKQEVTLAIILAPARPQLPPLPQNPLVPQPHSSRSSTPTTPPGKPSLAPTRPTLSPPPLASSTRSTSSAALQPTKATGARSRSSSPTCSSSFSPASASLAHSSGDPMV